MNRTTSGWEDGNRDPYPWAILGTVAAMRGQLPLAHLQQATIEKKFVSRRALATINELGFYQCADVQPPYELQGTQCPHCESEAVCCRPPKLTIGGQVWVPGDSVMG